MQVERCVSLGENTKSQKASKQTKPLDLEEKADKTKVKKENKKEENLDPEFKEFLEVHSKKQAEKNVWSNDAVDGAVANSLSKDQDENDNEQENPTENGEDKVAHKKELSDLDVRNFCYL